MSISHGKAENGLASCLMDLKQDETRTLEQDPLSRLLADFLNELEYNQKIIKEFSGGKLLPLETGMWEANQRMVHHMIPNLKRNLTGIYDDIGQINHMVWLSTEFNHNSANMCAQYTNLSKKIASNLEKMIKRIRCFNQVERALSLISIFD